MDIAILMPRSPEMDKDQFDSIHNSSTEMMPLGVFYIATVLKNHGYQVSVVDFNVIDSENERQGRLDEVIRKKPKIIGISTSTLTYPAGKAIARHLRTALGSESVVVWGGYHVTFLPDEPLQEGLADIVVRGEGDYAMLQIAQLFLEGKGSIDEIEGISYSENGSIIHNSPAVLRIMDLRNLPIPERSFVDLSKYRNPSTIISSRGCVVKCQFCAAGSFGKVAMRTTDSVVAEIKSLYLDYGFRHLFFVDNTFTTYKKRTIEILNRVKEEGIHAKFSIESRASQVDGDYIKALADHNVIAVQFGVETGNESVMIDIKKKITLSQVEKAVDLCLDTECG